ncbi:unnamed protein product [marine sediment metagenome]|uniref:Uncharacterized protein n=1 Tax=marine sediment metagenome TaxID=412755 RepID=X1IZ52_9ZZZZ
MEKLKEIKVATLTRGEKLLLKELLKENQKARDALEETMGKAKATQELFWRQLQGNHRLLPSANHFIRGNAIYKYEL